MGPLLKQMICAWPRKNNITGKEYACGKCMNCRINRRMKWTLRMILEAQQHPGEVTFVTLTYDEKHVPLTLDGLPTLRKEDITLYMKRLRKYCEERFSKKIRFFLCGEYGPQTFRPHYHMILYGLHPLYADQAINDTWEKGRTQIDNIYKSIVPDIEALQYVCGYVVKKMTHPDDDLLVGREPEFMRSSRRPGIGVGAVSRIADIYLRNWEHTIEQDGDIRPVIRINGRLWPIDELLRKKIRNYLGIPELARDRAVPPAREITLEQLNHAKYHDDRRWERYKNAKASRII